MFSTTYSFFQNWDPTEVWNLIKLNAVCECHKVSHRCQSNCRPAWKRCPFQWATWKVPPMLFTTWTDWPAQNMSLDLIWLWRPVPQTWIWIFFISCSRTSNFLGKNRKKQGRKQSKKMGGVQEMQCVAVTFWTARAYVMPSLRPEQRTVQLKAPFKEYCYGAADLPKHSEVYYNENAVFSSVTVTSCYDPGVEG